VAVFLVMPIVVFIWLIGWTLIYLGSKQKPAKPKVTKHEELTFAVLPQIIPKLKTHSKS
jgi:hypothetical protein